MTGYRQDALFAPVSASEWSNHLREPRKSYQQYRYYFRYFLNQFGCGCEVPGPYLNYEFFSFYQRFDGLHIQIASMHATVRSNASVACLS